MALPPYYQRQKELGRILASPDVQDALGNTPIDGIMRTGHDEYRVNGGSIAVIVHVRTSPDQPPRPGPRMFDLVVGTPQPAQ